MNKLKKEKWLNKSRKDKKEKKIKDQFVLIYWKDAAMHGTFQTDREDAKKECNLMKGISGGILVNEDKEQVTLALDWFHEEDQFRQIASYPKSGIYRLIRYYFGIKK